MSEWKMEITCPKGHKKNILLYCNEYELMFSCVACKDNHWWEPNDKELKENGVIKQ